MNFKAKVIETTLKEVNASILQNIVVTVMNAVPDKDRDEEQADPSQNLSQASPVMRKKRGATNIQRSG